MVCGGNTALSYHPSPFFDIMFAPGTKHQGGCRKRTRRGQRKVVVEPESYWFTKEDGTISGEVELPGVRKEEVEVDVKENVLCVQGVRRRVREASGGTEAIEKKDGEVKEVDENTLKEKETKTDESPPSDTQENDSEVPKPKEDSAAVVKRYECKVELPRTADVTKVQAKYTNGILYVEVPKKAEEQPRRITVDA